MRLQLGPDVALIEPPAAAAASPLTGVDPVAPGLSLRANFVWVLAGNVVFAICQWGAIVALAKLGSSFVLGQFSLGLAIATPVLMFTNLHLRVVQATDARRLHSFGEYLRLRIGLSLVGLLAIVAIAFGGHYERQTAMVVVAVAVAKGIETLSDIHYGLFQLNDRLDQTGKSMMLRGVLSVSVLGAGLYLTRSVLWSCAGLALAWLAALLFFDTSRGRRLLPAAQPIRRPLDLGRSLGLMRTALPLGFATTMAALNLNIPRYFIHARLGERQLGVYSALAYATVAMVLVSDSIGHCAIPRLSRLYSADRLAEFRSLLLKLLALGAAIGAAGVAAALCIGKPLLALLYGKEYAAQHRVFLVLILSTAIYCVASMFTSAITAARCFRIQVPLYALIVAANTVAAAFWVPASGLAGGAAALAVASVVHLVLGASVVFSLLWAASGARKLSPLR
jgi:O-antigen/teichoic acid export membrane protein